MLILISLILCVILAIVLMVASPRAILALGFAIWGINVTIFLPAWGLMAIVGIALTLVAGFKAGPSGRRPVAISYVAIAVATWGLLISPLSIAPGIAALESLILVLFGLAVLFVSTRFTGRDVCVAAYIVLMSFAVTSVFMSPAAGSVGSQSRWSGVFNHPNTLGLFLFSLIAVSFGVGKRALIAASAVGGPLVLLSASRGSALACLAALGAGLWSSAKLSHSKRGRLVLRWIIATGLLLSLAVIIVVIKSAASTDARSGLLRSDYAGRISVLEDAWSAFLAASKFGYGMGLNAPDLLMKAHVQVVTIAVMLGVFGILAYGVVIVLLLRLPWGRSPALAALSAGALVSWISESWMFNAGMLHAGIFWIAVSALAADLRPGAVRVSTWPPHSSIRPTISGWPRPVSAADSPRGSQRQTFEHVS